MFKWIYNTYIKASEEIDSKLLLIHQSIYFIGMFFETLWGLYIKNYTADAQFDDLRVRVLMSFFLFALLITSFKKNFYNKHYKWLTLFLIISYNIQRYYILSLNPSGWNSIIDCYTMSIMATMVAPTLPILYTVIIGLFIPTLFFPAHDYNLSFNVITVLPLVGAFKWSDFKNQIELKKAQERLKKTSILTGAKTFIGTISHDINNSLQKINLLNSLYLETKDQNALSLIHEKIGTEISKTAQIIINFKDVISDQAPNEQFLLSSTIIQNALLVYNEKLDSYKIKLHFPIDDFYIYGDERILRNIMQPIIKNAMDEVQNLIDVIPEISFFVKEDNLYHYLMISNNGSKIEPTISDKIFEPFFTTKAKGSGMGLGLSIAKDIATKNNIDLYYDKSYDLTTFVLKIKKVSNPKIKVS